MSVSSFRPKTKGVPKGSVGRDQPREWKSLFKNTILLVLAISLAVHVLILLAFGSVAIFKGSIPKLPFVSQEIATESPAETAPPPPEEEVSPVEEITTDPFAQETPESSAAEDSAPALDMLTVVGGANWAPAIPKNTPVAETGVMGGTGKGTGVGSLSLGGAGLASGKQLFGISIKARKLGVIVSINQAAQNSGRLPGIFEEIFKEFPDAYVFLTNGGGIMDWDQALKEFNDRVTERKKKEKETGVKIPGPDKMEKPKVARFNTGEALDWIAVRGSTIGKDYPGLKSKYPNLFDDLRGRPNVWFISGYKDANACHLAFEELIRRGVEAVYWYNNFESPITGGAAENLLAKLKEGSVEVIVQNQGGRIRGIDWLNKVNAKVVK